MQVHVAKMHDASSMGACLAECSVARLSTCRGLALFPNVGVVSASHDQTLKVTIRLCGMGVGSE